MSEILGKDTVDLQLLPPEDAVEFTRRAAQDVIWLQAQELMGEWGSVCSIKEAESWTPREPSVHSKFILPYCDAVKNSSIGLSVGIFGPFMQSYLVMGPTPIQDFLLNTYLDCGFVEYVRTYIWTRSCILLKR